MALGILGAEAVVAEACAGVEAEAEAEAGAGVEAVAVVVAVPGADAGGTTESVVAGTLAGLGRTGVATADDVGAATTAESGPEAGAVVGAAEVEVGVGEAEVGKREAPGWEPGRSGAGAVTHLSLRGRGRATVVAVGG